MPALLGFSGPRARTTKLRKGLRGILSLALTFATALRASTYHLDCQTGNDSNNGLGPSTAWRTIERANQQAFGPGDQILLKRGCIWSGAGLQAHGNGSVQSPIA